MAILVTGGAGFVGSHLTKKLISQGKQVVVIDNFDPYYDVSVKEANARALEALGVPIVRGDIRNDELVEHMFTVHDITKVAHLAGMAGVRYSMDKPRLYTDVNVGGSVTLLEAAKRHNCEVFVQASTSSVYGNKGQIPFNEAEAADHPLAPYPASKRAIELFAYSYHQLYHMNITILRFFNVYGPNGRPDMMPMKTIEAILNDEEITAYDGGDLERDWTYIDDTVNGVIAALERPIGYEVINLGYGSPIALTEFIAIYERLIGKKAKVVSVPAPRSEPRITYCDNSKATELLGFAPEVGIEEGLRRTWEWYQQHFGV